MLTIVYSNTILETVYVNPAPVECIQTEETSAAAGLLSIYK